MTDQSPASRDPAAGEPDVSLDTTHALLDRIRGGDEEARENLVRRFLPGLRRWAHGRLPPHARSLLDTDDLVQVAVLRALARIDSFSAERTGSFLAYLHQILLNLLRDEVRRAQRHPNEPLPDDLALTREQILERTIGHGALAAYEHALETLNDEQRQAVILRIEFGFTHGEIAQALGRPSANSVRMQVARALVRLTGAMDAWRPA